MKLIVSHYSPDLDSITASWLIKRFLPGWQDADLQFVPAGQTLNQLSPDGKKNIVHVDTGLGQFDHHQTKEFTSATKKVFQHLKEKKLIKKKDELPIKKIVDLVTKIDHFQEIFFPDPTNDIYDLCLHQLIENFKKRVSDDKVTCEFGFGLLDIVLIGFKNKIQAEKEIKRGFIFYSIWGKGLALKSNNEEAVKLALKHGFKIVVRQNLDTNNLRIKIRPDLEKGLKNLFLKLKEADPKATWYLHPSEKMLLNGSSKNPKTISTKLSLNRVIEIIKNI